MSSVGDTVQTIAAYFGNAAEWYDFAIYGFFSDTIAQVFFPPSSAGHANLVMSYIVFGCAFFIRPLGGIITGHIGDKLGRKRAVVFSLCCMTFPTVAMGCLPTYEQVGGWSTALLVFCRMLQGFSVGGQLPSSLVYTLETKPKEHWGYYGSLARVSLRVQSLSWFLRLTIHDQKSSFLSISHQQLLGLRLLGSSFGKFDGCYNTLPSVK
mmetsp:Transcript_30798/g.56997  ORF Transcript_30798/g.56997 Transcript_30798/m.56997 type:complete len:209 (-) Transcript_30798:1335-1961(-)